MLGVDDGVRHPPEIALRYAENISHRDLDTLFFEGLIKIRCRNEMGTAAARLRQVLCQIIWRPYGVTDDRRRVDVRYSSGKNHGRTARLPP